MSNQQPVRGVFAVPTTPYNADGSQNLDELARGVDRVLATGVGGFLCLGATGEALALTAEEREAQITAFVGAVAGRATVVIGCMAYAPAEVSAQIAQAARLGADAVMITPPYYGGLSADAAIATLHSIMSTSELPVMVYNNPHSTGTDLLPSDLVALKDTGTFWCVKETSGEATRVRELVEALGDDVEVFVGADGIALEGFTQGASGWVAASAWLLPDACEQLFEAARDENWSAAVSLWSRLGGALAQIEGNSAFISLIKQALSARGSEQGPVRLPLPTADSADVEALLASIGALEGSTADV